MGRCALQTSQSPAMSETWTLTNSDEQKLESFQMSCLRRILGIRWFDFVPNVSVMNQTRQQSIRNRIRDRRISIFGRVRRLQESVQRRTSIFQEYVISKISGRLRASVRLTLLGSRFLTSSSLQFEVAYWPAMTLGGTVQLAAAHCPNERTLDWVLNRGCNVDKADWLKTVTVTRYFTCWNEMRKLMWKGTRHGHGFTLHFWRQIVTDRPRHRLDSDNKTHRNVFSYINKKTKQQTYITYVSLLSV